MGVRVTGILAVLNCFNVEKKLQTLSNGAVFGSSGFRVGEAAERVAGISTGLNCCNVERESQTLSSGAVFGSGGFRGEEAAERVVRISVLLNSINVEKNPGMSEKVAVVENSLGNDFYKRSVKKCRYE